MLLGVQLCPIWMVRALPEPDRSPCSSLLSHAFSFPLAQMPNGAFSSLHPLVWGTLGLTPCLLSLHIAPLVLSLHLALQLYRSSLCQWLKSLSAACTSLYTSDSSTLLSADHHLQPSVSESEFWYPALIFPSKPQVSLPSLFLYIQPVGNFCGAVLHAPKSGHLLLPCCQLSLDLWKEPPYWPPCFYSCWSSEPWAQGPHHPSFWIHSLLFCFCAFS